MMDEKVKKKLYERIEKETGVINKPTEVKKYHTLIASGFPHKLFDTWKEDSKRQYNDIYWAKIWSDHLKAQAYDNLMNSVAEQEEEAPVQEENDKEEVIPLIGDGEK